MSDCKHPHRNGECAVGCDISTRNAVESAIDVSKQPGKWDQKLSPMDSEQAAALDAAFQSSLTDKPKRPRDMTDQKFYDTIKISIAHEGSIYIIYSGKVPPLNGQEYLSVSEHNHALTELRAQLAKSEEARKELVYTNMGLTEDYRHQVEQLAERDKEADYFRKACSGAVELIRRNNSQKKTIGDLQGDIAKAKEALEWFLSEYNEWNDPAEMEEKIRKALASLEGGGT